MRRLSSVLLLLVLVNEAVWAAEPKVELLWPQGAPGAKGDEPADKPTLTVFLPDAAKATGTAVVDLSRRRLRQSGHRPRRAPDRRVVQLVGRRGLSSSNIATADAATAIPPRLQDAQRAIRTVRARAAEWSIDPEQIGIMGFSAGGHLASTAGTHFDAGDPRPTDPIQRVSCRPDFLILCYPVIAFDEPYTHRGSQVNLLGKDPDPALVRSLSNEKQVTPETPPTFLLTPTRTGAPAENSVYFYLALRKAGVPAELHVYRTGRHGVGLAAGIPGTCTWPDRLKDWMQIRGLLRTGKSASRSSPWCPDAHKMWVGCHWLLVSQCGEHGQTSCPWHPTI